MIIEGRTITAQFIKVGADYTALLFYFSIGTDNLNCGNAFESIVNLFLM